MRVRDKMTPYPITVTPKTTVAEALDLMREKKVRRLPVIEKGQLLGIVTDRDLCEVTPSPATSLSIFEMNYLLARTKIAGVIKKQNVIVIEPDAYLEEAALLMRDNQVGAIPVVENDKLIGIITESDIFEALIELMGLREIGTRLEVEIADDPEVLVKTLAIISQEGGNISHIAVFHRYKGRTNLITQLRNKDTGKIVEVLEKEGVNLTSIAWKGHATID